MTYTFRSTRSSQTTCCTRHSIMLTAQRCETRKCLLTAFLANPRHNVRQFWKLIRFLLMESYIPLLIFFFKVLEVGIPSPRLRTASFCTFYQYVLYCTWRTEKYTGKIIHIIICIVILPSCCVLNCTLPTCGSNFVEVSRNYEWFRWPVVDKQQASMYQSLYWSEKHGFYFV